MRLRAGYSKKGQLKIQQMAFILVAIMIFFGLVALIYFSLRISTIEKSAVETREEGAMELVRKIAGSPEFAFTSEDCSNCIDMDKVLALSEMKGYGNFWSLDYLAVKKIYPEEKGECARQTYPDCESITIINGTSNYGAVYDAFVSLCRWEDFKGGYFKCELGRIEASGRGINGK